jgi:DTW domain-containing protein YfiP
MGAGARAGPRKNCPSFERPSGPTCVCANDFNFRAVLLLLVIKNSNSTIKHKNTLQSLIYTLSIA